MPTKQLAKELKKLIQNDENLNEEEDHPLLLQEQIDIKKRIKHELYI